mgnify:CR=1 FL=1
MALTSKQQRFVDEYLIDLNGAKAAIRAGYSEKTARNIASENLAKPDIAEAVAAAAAMRSERTQIDADWVLREAQKLYALCIDHDDRTNAKGTLDLIGKHVDVAAFKERVEHSGGVRVVPVDDADERL